MSKHTKVVTPPTDNGVAVAKDTGTNIFARMWRGAKNIASSVRGAFVRKYYELRGKPLSATIFILVVLAMLVTLCALVLVVYFICYNGITNLTPELFEWEYTTANQSMMPALVNTVLMVVYTLIIAVPIGVFAAIFLVEYSDSQSRFIRVVRMAAETLAGLPSIVYGLFGLLFFVKVLGWGYSSLSGTLTMVLMVLPLITRTTEEALVSIPLSFREGSYALGAGKLRTVFRTVLPSAVPGILSGVILAIGRVVGETAALIFTLGSMAQIIPGLGANTDSVVTSGRTLALHVYYCFAEGKYIGQAYATAFVLLVLTLLINVVSTVVANKLSKGNK